VQKVGLCVCLYDLLKVSDGLIGHGSGNVNINGRMVMPQYQLVLMWELPFNSGIPFDCLPPLQGRDYCGHHIQCLSGGHQMLARALYLVCLVFHLKAKALSSIN
jgi:hypothetical protein